MKQIKILILILILIVSIALASVSVMGIEDKNVDVDAQLQTQTSIIYSYNLGTKIIKLPTDCESNPGTCQNIIRYKFYLPTAAYTYIDVSGQLSNIYNAAEVRLKIDNVESMTRSRFFTNTASGLNTNLETGVQISTTNRLEAGYHLIYLSGYQINGSINPGMTTLGQISITVVANQNGNIVKG